MPSWHYRLALLLVVMFRWQASLALATFRSFSQNKCRQQRLACITSRQFHMLQTSQHGIMARRSHTNESVGNLPPDDAIVKEETLNWLRRVVIGLNLCPFADKPLRQDAVHVTVIRGNDDEIILSSVFDELMIRTTEPGTTLVVCPECFPDDFLSYLDVLNLIETCIIKDDATFEGVVQIAPFHPLFQFEGSGPDSIDNWTNRSPYPLFHILREDEVTVAVDRLDGDAGKVWRRNADLIQAIDNDLGSKGLEAVMRGETNALDQTRLRDIMKRFRVELSNKAP